MLYELLMFLLDNDTDNYIDGKEFLTLSEAEIKIMVPPIGIARKILRLVPNLKVKTFCHYNY